GVCWATSRRSARRAAMSGSPAAPAGMKTSTPRMGSRSGMSSGKTKHPPSSWLKPQSVGQRVSGVTSTHLLALLIHLAMLGHLVVVGQVANDLDGEIALDPGRDRSLAAILLPVFAGATRP